jgi:hypothetical protein
MGPDRFDDKPLGREPFAGLALFFVFTALSLNIASYVNAAFNARQIPKSAFEVTIWSTAVIWVAYVCPLCFFRPTAIWRRYPTLRGAFIVAVACPIVVILALSIVVCR